MQVGGFGSDCTASQHYFKPSTSNWYATADITCSGETGNKLLWYDVPRYTMSDFNCPLAGTDMTIVPYAFDHVTKQNIISSTSLRQQSKWPLKWFNFTHMVVIHRHLYILNHTKGTISAHFVRSQNLRQIAEWKTSFDWHIQGIFRAEVHFSPHIMILLLILK